MECKQCSAPISIEIAGESARNIRIFCEAVGMAPEAVASFVAQRGPLCRQCMEAWGTNRGELAHPPAADGR